MNVCIINIKFQERIITRTVKRVFTTSGILIYNPTTETIDNTFEQSVSVSTAISLQEYCMNKRL